MIMVGCWLNFKNLPKIDQGNYEKIKIHFEMNVWTKLDQDLTDKNWTGSKDSYFRALWAIKGEVE